MINEEMHYLGQYLAYKKTYAEFLKSSDKGAYRQAHISQIDAYEQARTFLKDRYPNGKLPTIGDLKVRKSKLEKEQKHCRSLQQSAYNQMKELRIVDINVTALLAPRAPQISL